MASIDERELLPDPGRAGPRPARIPGLTAPRRAPLRPAAWRRGGSSASVGAVGAVGSGGGASYFPHRSVFCAPEVPTVPWGRTRLPRSTSPLDAWIRHLCAAPLGPGLGFGRRAVISWRIFFFGFVAIFGLIRVFRLGVLRGLGGAVSTFGSRISRLGARGSSDRTGEAAKGPRHVVRRRRLASHIRQRAKSAAHPRAPVLGQSRSSVGDADESDPKAKASRQIRQLLSRKRRTLVRSRIRGWIEFRRTRANGPASLRRWKVLVIKSPSKRRAWMHEDGENGKTENSRRRSRRGVGRSVVSHRVPSLLPSECGVDG